MHSVSYLHELS